MSAPKRIGADALRPGRSFSYVAIPVGSRRGTRFTAEAPLGEQPPAEEEGAREAPGRCDRPAGVETLTWSFRRAPASCSSPTRSAHLVS